MHIADCCVQKSKMSVILGPDQYGIFGAEANTNFKEQENSNIQHTGQYYIYIYIISGECGYQIF